MKIVLFEIVAVTFALLLNEVRFLRIQRSIQTMVYLPHFLSWVILAGILRTILARDGMLNDFWASSGSTRSIFWASPTSFPG